MQENSFEEAVRKALAPIAGTFAFERMVRNHLDVEKFRPWADYIDQYKPVRDSVVFCSGCGSGNEFPAYLDLGAQKVYGVEVEQPLVDLARLRFQGKPEETRVDVRLYDGDRLPFQDAMFDIVSTIHVIEHVRDKKQYLRELFRVLKPGGVLFLDVPNRFFPVEQHTGKKGIHLLPHPVAQFWVQAVLRAGLWIPAFKRDALKWKALEGYRPPFPGQIVRHCRTMGRPMGITIEQAYFHSSELLTS